MEDRDPGFEDLYDPETNAALDAGASAPDEPEPMFTRVSRWSRSTAVGMVLTGVALGKSTYARAGLLVNTTPLEAGWTGRLVVEIANLANLPLRVYINEGIGQILFFESDEDCGVSYEDRGGKYQGQTGLTFAKV